MKIDIHAHTSNHSLWNLHVKTASIEDLENLAKKYGIDKIILMATYFPFKKKGLFNRELFSRIKGNDLFSMFVSLDMTKNVDSGLKEMAMFLKNKMACGIKLYPGYQVFHLSDKNAFRVYQLAQHFNVPVAIHSGELHHCCPREDRDKGLCHCKKPHCSIDELQHLARPKNILEAAKFFPKVKFIMSHLGNPYFLELHNVMAECLNIYTDISGQFLSGSSEDKPEYRQEIINEIKKIIALPNGIERLMFATDFPIQSYPDSIEMIEALGLPSEDEEKIFSQNAVQIINCLK